jgi:hypothetical protein
MGETNLSISDVINGYHKMTQEWIDDGWDPFLLTFMFAPLTVKSRMWDEIDRVYATFVTRVARNPNSQYGRTKRPLLVTCLDGFCQKREKRLSFRGLASNEFNDGLHVHGILVVPPTSRLKQDVPEHFAKCRTLYIKNRLLRINVKPIDSNLSFVTDYAFKGLKTASASLDDIRIFPRAISECRTSAVSLS